MDIPIELEDVKKLLICIHGDEAFEGYTEEDWKAEIKKLEGVTHIDLDVPEDYYEQISKNIEDYLEIDHTFGHD